MRIKPSILLLFSVALIGLNGCMHDGPMDRTGPSAFDQRDAYGRSPYGYGARRAPGPWDMRQNDRQLGPSTWYGCPQQSRGCYSD